MPYNGRYYVNSIPKYKILITTKDGVDTAKVVSVTTFSELPYYEIFKENIETDTECMYYIENALSAHERHGWVWQILIDDRIVWYMGKWVDPFFAIIYAEGKS